MNIVKAATDLFIRITHSCLFGKHEKEFLIKQFKDGAEIREPVGQALQKVIEQSLSREYHLHLILFPELFPVYLTKFDRELKKNSVEIRKCISAMIKERRENPDQEEATDLLSILIKDPTFSTMDEAHIIDEAIAFFMAASMTQSPLLANTICYLI